MEAKLKEYRALRRRKEIMDKTLKTLEKSKQTILKYISPQAPQKMEENKQEEEKLLLENIEIEEESNDESKEEATDISDSDSLEDRKETWQYTIMKWSIYAIVWLSLFIYFLSLQFGAVFFVISLLIGICLNTRTRPKKRGEISAYSVFNEDCISIEGTVNAEQLQAEMMFGGMMF